MFKKSLITVIFFIVAYQFYLFYNETQDFKEDEMLEFDETEAEIDDSECFIMQLPFYLPTHPPPASRRRLEIPRAFAPGT